MRKGALMQPFDRTPRWVGGPLAGGAETRKNHLSSLQAPAKERREVRLRIAAKRATRREPVALVQPKRRVEFVGVAGLQAEPRIAAALRLGGNVGKHGTADAAAERMGSRSHGLHLAVIRVDLLQCTDTRQGAAIASRPERQCRVAQGVQWKDVAGVRGRGAPHGGEMQIQQRPYVRAIKVALVKCQLHRASVFPDTL
jgi:hypothetical protein